VEEHKEQLSRPAVGTNKKGLPMLDLHHVNLVSSSVPLTCVTFVSQRGDLSSRVKRFDIFSPDPLRTDSEASNTNLRQVIRQISSATASNETFSSDIA
jgi:hypothetical protein